MKFLTQKGLNMFERACVVVNTFSIYYARLYLQYIYSILCNMYMYNGITQKRDMFSHIWCEENLYVWCVSACIIKWKASSRTRKPKQCEKRRKCSPDIYERALYTYLQRRRPVMSAERKHIVNMQVCDKGKGTPGCRYAVVVVAAAASAPQQPTIYLHEATSAHIQNY